MALQALSTQSTTAARAFSFFRVRDTYRRDTESARVAPAAPEPSLHEIPELTLSKSVAQWF